MALNTKVISNGAKSVMNKAMSHPVTSLMTGLMVYGTIADARENGIPHAAGSFVKMQAEMAFIPLPVQIGYGVSKAVVDGFMASAQQRADIIRQTNKYLGSGYVGSGSFDMSQAGYTMRQRAIQAMSANSQNLNTVLGNEARNYIKSVRKAW